MGRRHLQLTVDITLDEEAVQRDDIPLHIDGGDTRYSESLNLLRTAAMHHAAIILAPYDPQLTVDLTPFRTSDTF